MTHDYSLETNAPTGRQRRPEYVRGEEWIRDLLRRGQIAHIGSVWDKQPFVTPTTYYFDETERKLVFHSNIMGRLRANLERDPRAAAEVSEIGDFLPSNIALEFSLQYRSVMVFGVVQIITNMAEQRQMLHQLIGKYFRGLEPGRDFRPVTDKELQRTSVYAIKIEAWSGKENWKDHADQSEEWPALKIHSAPE